MAVSDKCPCNCHASHESESKTDPRDAIIRELCGVIAGIAHAMGIKSPPIVTSALYNIRRDRSESARFFHALNRCETAAARIALISDAITEGTISRDEAKVLLAEAK
jgi:hypothetical protein